jgi:hypothetical protein
MNKNIRKTKATARPEAATGVARTNELEASWAGRQLLNQLL